MGPCTGRFRQVAMEGRAVGRGKRAIGVLVRLPAQNSIEGNGAEE